jgi:hypothetical protein
VLLEKRLRGDAAVDSVVEEEAQWRNKACG